MAEVLAHTWEAPVETGQWTWTPARDDVGELYGALARRLEQIVRLDVRAPDVVIEDACQVAWTRLLRHRHRVRSETVMAWLAKTASHEALRSLRRGRRELSLEAEVEWAGEPAFLDRADEPALGLAAVGPHDLVEQRERLAGVGCLPERQQRMLWLHAFGLSYAEIAVHEDCTLRTVERQLLRAKRGVRELDTAA
jgi:RNA polymerase sigma factor (sigma-70 family)